jgi:hypothetical protein
MRFWAGVTRRKIMIPFCLYLWVDGRFSIARWGENIASFVKFPTWLEGMASWMEVPGMRMHIELHRYYNTVFPIPWSPGASQHAEKLQEIDKLYQTSQRSHGYLFRKFNFGSEVTN